jgi:acyl carrier protein
MPDDETSFLESGIIDSTGALAVVLFLEERFGVKVEDHEIVPENLDSISRLAGFVRRQQRQPEHAA